MASYSTGDTPIPTTDQFQADGRGPGLLCQGAGQVVVTVETAAAIVQLGHGGGGAASWEMTDHRLVPGVWPFTSKAVGIDAVRARSATKGVPSNISISAYG